MIPASLTTPRFAALHGVTDRTVRNWIESGQIPAAAVRVVGRQYRLLTAVLRQSGWLPVEDDARVADAT